MKPPKPAPRSITPEDLVRLAGLAEREAEEIANLRARVAELERLLADKAREREALAVLQEVEWEGENMGRSCCPSCGCLQPCSPPFKHPFMLLDDVLGHSPECRLAAVLATQGAVPAEGGGT